MPSATTTPQISPEFKHLKITTIHPTLDLGAEVEGIDFSQPIPDDVFQEILAAMAKYGVCVFRNTGLDDWGHVEFSRRFGELDDIRPYLVKGRKLRYEPLELFDAGNIDEDGGVLSPDSARAQYNKGNQLFHVDSSFNPRRASFSLLRAVILPPPSTGGNTDFSDTRSAFTDLPTPLKSTLLEKDYIVAHSLHHSRKTAAPEFFKDLDPMKFGMSRHRLVQRHEGSGRMNLYIAAHTHHVVGLGEEESERLLGLLMEHATQEKYRISVAWKGVGDLVCWDNTAVMHRAGAFEGGYKRDMRRTTVHDASSQAWGLNEKVDNRPGFNVDGLKKVDAMEAMPLPSQPSGVV